MSNRIIHQVGQSLPERPINWDKRSGTNYPNLSRGLNGVVYFRDPLQISLFINFIRRKNKIKQLYYRLFSHEEFFKFFLKVFFMIVLR